MRSIFNGKNPTLPMPPFWPITLLDDAPEITNKPTSVAGKAARAQVTANHPLHTRLLSQFPALALAPLHLMKSEVAHNGVADLSAASSALKSESSTFPAGSIYLP